MTVSGTRLGVEKKLSSVEDPVQLAVTSWCSVREVRAHIAHRGKTKQTTTTTTTKQKPRNIKVVAVGVRSGDTLDGVSVFALMSCTMVDRTRFERASSFKEADRSM